ncbi:MAG TPA: hypothetical protein EYP19_07480 [Desulfobacterales bacterium]|nr:hypothetical protein [Desulfobacterales bacterium]
MTDTYNPIIGKEEIPRLRLFHPRPTPEPGVALVLFREGQPLVTLWPGDRLTAGEVRWGNYKTIYKVDVTEHSFDFNCTLPCESDAFDFQAEVQVTCSVDNPAVIVERNITDTSAVLEPLIIRTMRGISRDYDVEESAAAEKAISRAVESEPYNVGLRLNRFVVKLSLEEEARAHIRRLRQIERDKERERREAELGKLRDELEMERMKMKMDFYSPLIREGHWQLLALQLTNHPEDVVAVAQMLSQQRQAEMDHQLKALKIMLEEDALEGFQIEEAGKRVLQRFVESFGPALEPKALGEVEERKALALGENKASAESKTKGTETEVSE